MMNSTSKDGEYELWYPETSVYLKIYCYNMTGNPSEYLTLPAGGISNYIYKGDPRNSETWGQPCRGEFSKVRLILTNPIRILRSDTTFMKTDKPKCSPLFQSDGKPIGINGYGGAGDCHGGWQGNFKIDLSGTPFKIPDDVWWKTGGSLAKVRRSVKYNNGKTVSAYCGGYCGSCVPSSGDVIPLDLVSGSCSNFM